MLVLNMRTSATRRSGSGLTHRDSTSLKRRLCIAKKLSRSTMAFKMVATHSMRGKHSMPLKCNTMIIKHHSMSNRKNEDHMVGKSSLDSQMVGCTPTLARGIMVVCSRRIQGGIKARRRCTAVLEEKSWRGRHNIRSSRRKTRARATWATRMTWMKVLLWPKEGHRRRATGRCNRRGSLMEDIRSTKRLHSPNLGRGHALSSLCMTLISKLVTKAAQMHKSRELQIIHHRSSKTHTTKLQHRCSIRNGTKSWMRNGKRSRRRSTWSTKRN